MCSMAGWASVLWKALLPVALVVLAVAISWILLWKLILEPNPIVRDFFDLEKPKKPTAPRGSRDGQRIPLATPAHKQTKEL